MAGQIGGWVGAAFVVLVIAGAIVGPPPEDDNPPADPPTSTASVAPTSTAVPTTTTEAPSTAVQVSIGATVRAGEIRATGTATVPDGAVIVWEAQHAEALTNATLCPVPTDGVDRCLMTGDAVAHSGAFSFDVAGMPSGPVEVWAAFQTLLGTGEAQPDEVIDLYGEMGEDITGSQVVDAGSGLFRVEVTTDVTIP